NREEARRAVAVEADFPVREVVHDDEVVLAGELHHLDEEVVLDGVGRRVVRIVEEEDLRAGTERLAGRVDLAKGLLVIAGRDAQVAGSRDDDGVRVDRERRRRHERGVAGPEEREAEVAESLLRADRRDDLRLGIELDAPLRRVVLRDFAPEVVDSGADRITMVSRILDDLAEL